MLGEIAEADLRSPERAKVHYLESLRLKPTQADLIEKVHGKEARLEYEEKVRKAMEAIVSPSLPDAAKSNG